MHALITFKLRICGGAIDYVFFHITEFNNLDLYDHLEKKDLVSHIGIDSDVKFCIRNFIFMCV